MKTNHIQRICGGAILSTAMLFAFAPKSHANLDYNVTLNVASLIGNGNGPFSLDFQLSSGATFADSDNTVTLNNFVVSGGSLGPITYSFGGETGGGGDASVKLVTSNATDNELAEQISGSVTQIQFHVSETTNTDNPDPDVFDVAVLDGSLDNIPTTDPGEGNTLVSSTIVTGATVSSVQTYSSTGGGEAPGVTATAVVPEPTSVASLLIGLGSIGLCGWKRAFRRSVRA